MKKTLQTIATLTLLLVAQISFAQFPQNITHIDINNIDAKISSSNDLFWDFSNAGFEVPKGSGLNSIFAGGLWIGGLDNGGNIHLAAQTYRQTGNDFWCGPIDTAAGAPSNYLLWDTSWKLNQSDVQAHIQNYTTPGYVVPQNIASWPGYNASLGRVLAPFADYNSNGIYDPENGDYPAIMGDQTVYSIFNDLYTHTESGCDMLGFEIHRTMYGFDDPADTALNNSIFSRYEVKNFSSNDYHDVYITLWTDFDLGNASDDYVGTDLNLNMVYCYNADSIDETAAGYGLNPPAVGVYFLNDSLAGSVGFENINNSAFGNPGSCNDFSNYGKSIWLDNLPVTYGETGRNPSNAVTTYMYSGTTDPVNYPLYGTWTEASAGNPPNDRRIIGSIGPFTIPANGYKSFDVGYTWARANSGGPLASVADLQNAVSNLRVLYNNGSLTSTPEHTGDNSSFTTFPNPASDFITIHKNKGFGKDAVVTICDLTGRVIYNQAIINPENEKINIGKLAKGVYIISVSDEKSSQNQKFIKQ